MQNRGYRNGAYVKYLSCNHVFPIVCFSRIRFCNTHEEWLGLDQALRLVPGDFMLGKGVRCLGREVERPSSQQERDRMRRGENKLHTETWEVAIRSCTLHVTANCVWRCFIWC
jgi:hypothetical protein